MRRTQYIKRGSSAYKDKYPLEIRKSEANKLLAKYPDRIPIIVEKALGTDLPTLDNEKFDVPDGTVGQFAKTIQKRLKLASDKPISIFVNDVLAPTASLLTAVYKEHKDQDDFLYLTYSSDSTSGGC